MKTAKTGKTRAKSGGDELFATQSKKRIPFDFVLDELSDCDPVTRPMFGSVGVYVGEKIVLILRERDSYPEDNGVWLATAADRHAALRPEFPNMRSITVFGPGETGWQVLSPDSADFETSVIRACELIRSGDPRIGKIPGAKKKAPTKAPVTKAKAKAPVSKSAVKKPAATKRKAAKVTNKAKSRTAR